jgi:lipopolysaccharide export system permease protein
VFFAVAYAANRLQNENETVVMSASGVSNARIAGPVLALASIAAVGHLALNTIIQPAANREMRAVIHDIRADVAASLVREGAFTFPTPTLTLYARNRGVGGEMLDLMINDARSDQPITYTARAGVVAMVDGTPSIILRDGQMQRQVKDGTLQVLDFYQHVLQIDELFEAPGEALLKASDRYLNELFYPDLTYFFDQRNVDRFLAEGHYRLSSPLLNIALALIALAGLLVGDFSRQGYGRRLLIAAMVALVVRLVALAIQAACVDEPELNALQYVFPIVVSAVAAARLMSARPRRGRLRVAAA